MPRTKHRFLSMLVAGALALGVGAAPALAGSDGCSADGCRAENAPAAVVGTVPTGPQAFPDGNLREARTVGFAPSTAPRGAVAAGEGGAGEHGSGGVDFAIAGAALVILAAGTRLVVAARRSKS
jgi:hypothetical protein